MWPLAVMSVLGMGVAIREAGRLVLFSRSWDSKHMHRILDAVSNGDVEASRALLKGSDPVTQWYKKRLASLESASAPFLCPDDLPEPGLSVLSFLATITTAAPLLGILGTVLGIIQSFSALGGATAIYEVSAGIGQALISTAAGLIVALCALLPHNVLAVLHARWNHATTVWARRLEKAIDASGRSS